MVTRDGARPVSTVPIGMMVRAEVYLIVIKNNKDEYNEKYHSLTSTRYIIN